jgi:hypothetical protein
MHIKPTPLSERLDDAELIDLAKWTIQHVSPTFGGTRDQRDDLLTAAFAILAAALAHD